MPNMRKITFILLILALSSCKGLLKDKDNFIGTWNLVEPAAYISGKGGAYPEGIKMKIIITKPGLLHVVKYIINGEDMLSGTGKPIAGLDKSMAEAFQKYALSEDKKVLVNSLGGLESALTYSESQDALFCMWGWFKKE